jgi:hypothetical protein
LPISVEHVHEQPIGPRPVCAALVAPHDPNRLESDLRVAGNGRVVGGSGVDDEAVVPSVVVIIFSVLLLNMGIEEWFSKRVRTALSASLAVAEAYLGEHHKVIRGDVQAMANDLNQNAFDLMGDPQKFANFFCFYWFRIQRRNYCRCNL